MSAVALQAPIHPNPALYTSPEMVMELALGMDPPYDVAARYGLANFELDALMAQEWFAAAIVKKRQELHDDGHLFSAKAGMMAEELYQQLFKAGLTGTLAHPLTLELAKQLAEIGQLKPRAAAGLAGSEPRFQINIQLNQGDTSARKSQRLDVTAVEVKPTTVSIGEALPAKPEGFRVPDFDLRVRPGDLVGTPQAVQAAGLNTTGAVPTSTGQGQATR